MLVYQRVTALNEFHRVPTPILQTSIGASWYATKETMQVHPSTVTADGPTWSARLTYVRSPTTSAAGTAKDGAWGGGGLMGGEVHLWEGWGAEGWSSWPLSQVFFGTSISYDWWMVCWILNAFILFHMIFCDELVQGRNFSPCRKCESVVLQQWQLKAHHRLLIRSDGRAVALSYVRKIS